MSPIFKARVALGCRARSLVGAGLFLAEETLAQTRYVLVVRVPRPVEVRIEDVYLSLASTTRPAMGFHITLLGPYFFSAGASPRFMSKVSAMCRSWTPFSTRLCGLGAFKEKDDNAVYLQIVEPQILLALHNALLEATAGMTIPQDERYREWYVLSYQPHVTLGLGLSDRELEEFLRSSTLRQFDESFEVSRIWLAEQVPHGPWQYVAEYPLGAPSSGEMDRAIPVWRRPSMEDSGD